MRLAALARRGLAARPLRTLLTAAGVALGVAMVAGTLLANQAASEAVVRAAQELYGRADLRVRAFDPAGFSPRAVNTLRALPGVIAAAPVNERRMTLSDPVDQVFSGMLVIGVDPTDEAAVRDAGLADGQPLSGSNGEVLVGATWAADHGLAIGDELILTGHRDGFPNLRIVGLLQPQGFGALSGGGVVVVTRATLEAALDFPTPTVAVYLAIEAGSEAGVQAALDAQMTEPFVVETAADAELALGRAQAGFSGIAFIFGLVAMAVGTFLVANTFAMTLSERTREIGLLRAAGMTRGQVLTLFGRQAMLLGVLGGALGALLGVAMAWGMIWFLRATRALLISGLPFNLWAVVLAFGLGLFVTLAGALLPILAAARVSPLDALRPSRQPNRTLFDRMRWLAVLELGVVLIGLGLYPVERGEFSLPAAILAVGLLLGGTFVTAIVLQPLARLVGRPFTWFFGAQGMLGRANLGRDRVRSGLTIGALIIGLASLVALGTVAESARATADRWVSSILPGGYAIRLGLPVDIDTLGPNFIETTGARYATPVPEFPLVMRHADSQVETSVAGIDPTVFEDTGSLIFVHGARATAFEALRDGGVVLVPDGVATREGLGVGSPVELGLPGQEPVTFEVAGIIAYTLPGTSADGALLISLSDARQVFGQSAASLWAMVPQAGITPDAFAAAVQTKALSFAGEALTAAQLTDDLGRSLDRLIGLFDVLALLAVVIAALGIVNTLSLGVLERAREIAVLRAHGMTTTGVRAMVVAEAAIMGAVGGLAAAATGLLTGAAVVALAAPADFGAGLVVPWALLLTVVLLGTGVAVLAGLYPARLAGRTPIVRSLMQFE